VPAKCTQGMKRDALYKCYPEDIEIRPQANGRHEKPDVEWLVKDILANGQMEPVGIWDDGGKPVLSFGFSRWRAISEINQRNLTPIKQMITCIYLKCNELGAFTRNISENRMRNPVSPIDDAHNIQRLLNWQMDEKDVAKIYFPTAATDAELKDAVRWIQERVKLIKLTPEAEQAMKDGRLNETAAQAIAKLSSAQQKEILKSKEGKVKAKDIKAVTPKSTRGRKPNEPKAPTMDAELLRRITAVSQTANWEDYDEAKTVWVEVNAEAMAALDNYVKESAAL
jgi:hypothetical protein